MISSSDARATPPFIYSDCYGVDLECDLVSILRAMAWSVVDCVGPCFLLHNSRDPIRDRLVQDRRVCLLPLWQRYRSGRICGRLHMPAEPYLDCFCRHLALGRRRGVRHPLVLYDHGDSVWHRMLSHCKGQFRSVGQEGCLVIREASRVR